MLKKRLEEDLKKVVKDLGFKESDVVLSIPFSPEFGDYTTNSPLQLAKQESLKGKQSPLTIANELVSSLNNLSYLEKIEIAGPGFINFFLKPTLLAQDLVEILQQGNSFGKNNLGKGEKVQVEFVSANPTGPLTLPNGRGGVIGDSLSNVLIWSGYNVTREYYVNDTGNQVRLLGESVLAAAGKVKPEENHYKGEYVKDLAVKFSDQLDLDPQSLGHQVADYLLESEIKPALQKLGIKFDDFYSERAISESGLIKKTIELLKEKGVAYDKDNALWFKSTQFGDEKDRVLMTSEEGRGRSEPTYFLSDIAHHLDIFEQGFSRRINVLGADHHSYGQRIKGAMEALGYGGKLDIIFMQMVKLYKGGQEVRMSKRAGNFVTLDELLEMVSADVARFFLLMYSPDSQINFNLDLASEQSNKNPVFYVQYAHARMVNILNKATDAQNPKAELEVLNSAEELNLIRHLLFFPELVATLAQNYQVHRLSDYAIKLADLFHKFYERQRVLNAESEKLRGARLSLVWASKIVLSNVLNILGIKAPERM